MGTTSRRRPLSVAVAALLTGPLLLAGCGGSSGGGGGDGGSSADVTKADFVAKANAVCRGFSVKSSALPTPDGTAATNPKGGARSVLAAADLLDQQVDALVALKRPKADDAHLTAVFQTTRTLVARLRKDGNLLAKGDAAGLTDLQGLDSAGSANDKGYDDYGMKECGSDA